MQAMTIAAGKLPPYLAKDEDTRIFLVTGPLRRISAIQEMSHG